MRRGSALVLLVAAACTSKDTITVELTDYPIDYGFFVVYDLTGVPTRVTSTFGLDEGRLGFGALPAMTLEDDEAGLALVGLDRAVLEALAPNLDEGRIAELAVHLAPPPEAPRLDTTAAGGAVLRARVPRGARVFGAKVGAPAGVLEPIDPSLATWLSGVTLEVPVDPEHCRVPNETPFEAFAADENAFAGAVPDVAGTIRQLRRLDDDRTLVITSYYAAIIERGGTLVDPRAAAHLERAPELPVQIRGVDVDRGPASGPRQVTVVGGIEAEPFGIVWDLETDGGSIALVRTTTLTEDVGSVVIEPSGRTFISTASGAILARAPGEVRFSKIWQLELYAPDPEELATMIATGDPATPFLAATRARLHVFDATVGRWTATPVLQEGITSAKPIVFHALGVAHRGDRLELWAGAQRGYLFRKIGDRDWQKIHLAYPPSFALCGSIDEETEEVVFDDTFDAIAVSDDYVHLVARQCSAILQVRRSDLCTSALPHGERIEIRDQRFQAAAVGPSEVIVGGDGGLLLRAGW